MKQFFDTKEKRLVDVCDFTADVLDTFFEISIKQDEKGMAKYGVPMSDDVVFNGGYDWPTMILEELADATKYVIAAQRQLQHVQSLASYQKVLLLEQENTRLKVENAHLHNELIETNAQLNKVRAFAIGYLKG